MAENKNTQQHQGNNANKKNTGFGHVAHAHKGCSKIPENLWDGLRYMKDKTRKCRREI